MASIEIAPGWVDAIQKYVEGLMAETSAAASLATNVFREKVQEQARADEQWSSLADNIEVWSKDGNLVIGIQDQHLASQATLLEYGDLESPPNPLFRRLTSATQDASKAMREHMEARYGPAASNGGQPTIKGMRV